MSSEEKDRQSPALFMAAVAQFCVSSVGMMIGNKMAMDYLRDAETGHALPSTLVVVQVIGTLALLGYFRQHIDKDKLTPECAKSWIPIFTLFAGMIYTSAKTFQYVHVSFVIIVRNVGAIVTTFVEYFVRNTTVNAQILIAEITIVFGTVLYSQEGSRYFKDFWAGIVWCMLNVVCQTLYGVTLKWKMDHDKSIKEMSKYTMSLFNNLLCLPYLVVVACVSGEPWYYSEILPAVPMSGWVVILVTCVIGFMISTSGFGLQKLVSATTFLVINNMTKILNIILGIVFLNDNLPGGISVLGCFISLGGGFWYSYQTMQLNEQRRLERIEAEKRQVEDIENRRTSSPPNALLERRPG
eukprot:TRINITY_DN8513_c0_g1_i2.p1 TRINITY_DN8513_c0_g1~~TRINITY_DN8513_c0_g1_i2.p1  ORF type:complete len:367 (+),score=124.45 TRINITY_DN8513_c0_g1_i2:42-1103(+)